MMPDATDSPAQEGPLSDAINAATRPLHTKLNRLILARMPLALPPLAADPTNYLLGLLHVAPIYGAFEDMWRQIAEKPLDVADESFPGHLDARPAVDGRDVDDRVRSIVASFYIPGLVRFDRMRADIASLTASSPQTVEERLRSVSRTGHLAAFVDHIRRVISRKPHVLVAYTYILYMALFAGGRFIRATLEKPGLSFWEPRPDSAEPSRHFGAGPCAHAEGAEYIHESDRSRTLPSDPDFRTPGVIPVRFLQFDTAADGEDLKNEYKLKLSESEASLTRAERDDIVQEGICIFENMILLVHQLDAVCAAETRLPARPHDCLWSVGDLMKNAHAIGDRFRDSIAITKQRWEKTSAKEPIADDNEAGRNVDAASACPAKRRSSPDLCPASAKSVRFNGASPHPIRRPQSSSELDPKRVLGTHAAKWLLATMVGILTLSLFFTGRRDLLGWRGV